MGKTGDADILVVDRVTPAGAVGRRFREGSEEGEPVLCQPHQEGSPAEPGRETGRVEHLTGNMYRIYKLGGGDGPAQVATEAYRTNYDAIFGVKPRGKQYLS